MDIRLFLLALACMACVVPSQGGLITKLLAKKAIGAGAAIIAGKAALIKEGLASLESRANLRSQDCDHEDSLGAVDKIIETKKKLISDIIGLKQNIINNVVEEKHQLINELSKPEVIVVKDVPQPLIIDGPARPLVNFHPLVEFPQLHQLPPHNLIELPQFPPQYLNVELPPRPVFPQRLYPAPPPQPFLHRGPIHPAEPIPIRNLDRDCL